MLLPALISSLFSDNVPLHVSAKKVYTLFRKYLSTRKLPFSKCLRNHSLGHCQRLAFVTNDFDAAFCKARRQRAEEGAERI